MYPSSARASARHDEITVAGEATASEMASTARVSENDLTGAVVKRGRGRPRKSISALSTAVLIKALPVPPLDVKEMSFDQANDGMEFILPSPVDSAADSKLSLPELMQVPDKPAKQTDVCKSKQDDGFSPMECESCMAKVSRLYKMGKISICKNCECLMRAMAGSGRRQPSQKNSETMTPTKPSIHTNQAHMEKGIFPRTNHAQQGPAFPRDADSKEQRVQLDTSTATLFEFGSAAGAHPLVSTIAPSSLLLSQSAHNIPCKDGEVPKITKKKYKSKGEDGNDVVDSMGTGKIKEPIKKVPPQFHSVFPSTTGKKRGRKPKIHPFSIGSGVKDAAVVDSTNANSVIDRAPVAISNSSVKESVASVSLPLGNTDLTGFQTTGAFLTRTASKLLGGQKVIGVDSNIHGYSYGRAVKVKNIDGTWYFGSMIGLEGGRINVHFDGWTSDWDEWIASDSRRLRILDTEELDQREAALQSMKDAIQGAEAVAPAVANLPVSATMASGTSTIAATSTTNVPSTSQKAPSKARPKKRKPPPQPAIVEGLSHSPSEEIIVLLPSMDHPKQASKRARKSEGLKGVVSRHGLEAVGNRPSTLKCIGDEANLALTNTVDTVNRAESLSRSQVNQLDILEFKMSDSQPDLQENSDHGHVLKTKQVSDVSSEGLSDPVSSPEYSVGWNGKADAQETDVKEDLQTEPPIHSLGNPIQLGLVPPEILSYRHEDEEAELLRIIHRVLDTGLVKNRVIEHPSYDYYAPISGPKKKKKATATGPDGEGKASEDVSNTEQDVEGEDPPKRTNTKTRDRFVAQLEARRDYGTAGSVSMHSSTPAARKDQCELKQTRELAMRNMCSAPMIQFARQVIYNEVDRSTALNNTFMRRKQKLIKSLPGRKLDKWRHGPLSKRILGLTNMAGVTFNEAGHIETTVSLKLTGTLKKLQKAKTKKKMRLGLMKMDNIIQGAADNKPEASSTFQSLRSLTSSKKRTRVLAEDHITVLRRTMVPGTRIQARDRQMDWLTAVIRDVKNSRVLVHYEGFQEFFNEWIDINSERLRYDSTLEQRESAQKQTDFAVSGIAEVALGGDSPAESNPEPAAGEELPLDTVAPIHDGLSEDAAVEVHCVQCNVKISQFRIYCTYCEVEGRALDSENKSFNLCLWCFSNAFPEHHDHPRNSFATKVIVGPRGVRPVKGGIITRFEKDLLDLEYKEPEKPNVNDIQEAHFNAMMSLENDQGFMYLDQWKDRRVCAFCNDDGTSKDHFVGPYPFLLATTNRYGDFKKRHYWAHDACARHSPEVIQGKDGSWYNVSMAMRRGRTVKCTVCKEKGATIGCFDPKCGRSFHVPCTGKPMSHFEDGVIFWCPQHERALLQRDAYEESFSCDSCSHILGVNPWQTCVKCSDDYFHTFDLCRACFSKDQIDHEHGKDDFRTTSLELMHKEQLEKEAAQTADLEEPLPSKKKSVSYKPKLRGLSRLVCSYCWSATSAKWRKGYNGVLMCEDCFLAGPVNETPMQPPIALDDLPATSASDPLGLSLPTYDTNDRGVGRYATSAEDYSHSPYLTRTAVSAVRFDHLSSQAVYLDSYGPAENQLYSLPIDTTYYDIPGRAPRWATHSGTDYHGTWLPQTVRRAVTKYTKPNDKILSNFLGRGTDAIECFLLGRCYQLIRQYINEGFELEELIVKRQRYCAMFGLGTYLCVQFDFLCFTHEFVATLRKVPKENLDTMILEPDFTLLDRVDISSTLRSIPSCPIERKSVVMGSVWTFKPTEEYDFPTLCVSRMVERFGRNDANWEEFKLDFRSENSEETIELFKEHAVEILPPDEEDLVSYERDRLQQIQENNRMLLALGLITDLSETSDDIGHQNKIAQDTPCFPPPAQTALRMLAHIPCSVLKSHQVSVYRTAIMHLAIEALENLPITGVFIVGTQDLRTEEGRLIPLGMLVLEDIIRVVGEDCLRLKELVEAVPEGYQKDRRKVTCWDEFKEETCTPNDEIPTTHLPIVHACYLVFTKVKSKQGSE
ncbi:hypothetical protein EC968_003513 [Mortierella alpina]|nr:hypothetical protein EC968_003513 [Mortierella alpina]